MPENAPYQQDFSCGKLDEPTFLMLFKRHWEQVYGICRHYTTDHDDACDLTQNVFLDLWKNRERLAEDSNFEHYLSRAARYQSLNYMRNRTKRERHITAMQGGDPEGTETDRDPHALMEDKEFSRRLAGWMAAIPEPARTLFALHREENLTYREIAVQHNLPVRTVHYHISMALAFLRKKLINK